MSEGANQYSDHLSSSISARDMQVWEEEIRDAESRRLADVKVMDILGARQAPEEERGTSSTGGDPGAGQTEQWIRMGLDLQEKQWVVIRTFKTCVLN
jgi:hypothetical protein